MDNSMVKRGIGALVLAIIAALLLGWLLKDKSQERQEVMEIKLPNAPEMNIPSLSDTVDNVTDGAASLVGEATDKVAGAGSAVVAAATGAAASVKDGVNNAVNNTTDAVAGQVANGKPGFSIRPSQQNEEKEITDNTQSGLALITSSEPDNTTTPAPANNTVVASTKKKVENFKPRIVEKKKKPVKQAKKEPKKVVKAVEKATPAEKPKQAETAPSAAPAIATAASGKYSIQLLATSSQSRANKLAKTMSGEGYKAFITQTTNNNKILYRVRVGGHADRSSAIKAQEGMKRRYQKNFFVQNSLVISN